MPWLNAGGHGGHGRDGLRLALCSLDPLVRARDEQCRLISIRT